MPTISDIFKEYSQKLDHIDLELLIAHAIGKNREFVLSHPEYKTTRNQELGIRNYVKKRTGGTPIAYILKHKEFFGLDFEVNKNTLIPRPETELLVELAQQEALSVISHQSSVCIVDVGTGSGNIIISIAKNITGYQLPVTSYKFFGIDISNEALKVARRNAKRHSVNKKIKFLHGNLLAPWAQDTRYKIQDTKIIILANLPYLSKEIFNSAPIDVKKFEPKSALYSSEKGLSHYKKLFTQIKKLLVTSYELQITILIEFSPEQKKDLQKLIKTIFPKSKTSFHKDLAGKWRIAQIKIA